MLSKIPTFLKPFLPQLQRTFAKSLADPSSEVLRSRAAKALGTLITMTPRVDPLIAGLLIKNYNWPKQYLTFMFYRTCSWIKDFGLRGSECNAPGVVRSRKQGRS